MISILLILFTTLWSLGSGYQVNEPQALPPKMPLRPGDLLRSLDALTSDAQVIYSPLHEDTPKNLAERRVFHEESLNDNKESASEYDYDKAYEHFVNKYFAKGEEELESDDHENDDADEDEKAEEDDAAAPFEFSSEIDEESKNKKKSSSGSKTCERVTIDNQNCKVCEDPKTNEKSKTCSYSSDSKPKSYGYKKQKSTKHSSDGDDDGSYESGRSLKREAPRGDNKQKFQPRRTNIDLVLKSSSDDASKCTRKPEGEMVCFYCGSTSESTRECFNKRHSIESSKKDSSTKKIFKRMVTYSFKNGAKPIIKEKTYANAVSKGY